MSIAFRTLVLTGVVTLVSGCTSPLPSSTPTSVTATTPIPTTAATATPAPTPIATPRVITMGDGGETFPGTYKTAFVPALTLTINDLVNLDCAPGYRCRGDIDVNSEGWLDLEFGNKHGVELMVFRVDKVFKDAAGKAAVDPPNDLAAFIASRPHVAELGPRTEVMVGGLSGTQLDLRVKDDVQVGPTFGIAGSWGKRAWITVVRVDAHWVVIMEVLGPESAIDRADFERAIRGLQPIIDSIRWE